MVEFGHAYWLINEIVLLYTERLFTDDPVSSVDPHRQYRSVGNDGNRNVVFEKNIAFTHFPLDKIDFHFSNNFLIFPTEWRSTAPRFGFHWNGAFTVEYAHHQSTGQSVII